jgi:hypothetical protein
MGKCVRQGQGGVHFDEQIRSFRIRGWRFCRAQKAVHVVSHGVMHRERSRNFEAFQPHSLGHLPIRDIPLLTELERVEIPLRADDSLSSARRSKSTSQSSSAHPFGQCRVMLLHLYGDGLGSKRTCMVLGAADVMEDEYVFQRLGLVISSVAYAQGEGLSVDEVKVI